MLYCTDYRFYQSVLGNSWIFIKKNRDTFQIQNIFRIPSFTICFFYFVVFLTSFFAIFPVHDFQKKFIIFVLFYCMDPRFYQKILQNYGFFSRKKLRYLKSKISIKFHRLQFHFYFFSISGILFSFSSIQTFRKVMKFFCNVLPEGLEILPTISWIL